MSVILSFTMILCVTPIVHNQEIMVNAKMFNSLEPFIWEDSGNNVVFLEAVCSFVLYSLPPTGLIGIQPYL